MWVSRSTSCQRQTSCIKYSHNVPLGPQGGLAARPLLAVPHILADESSCYYHGYVLAEMSVHQTRAHFKAKYGKMVDNPQVGGWVVERLEGVGQMLVG